MRGWEQRIPAEDRATLAKSMGDRRPTFGARPALLVVDVLYGFTGTEPLPVLAAIDEYPTSCGAAAWDALPHVRTLVEAFRAADLPRAWTKGDPQAGRIYGGVTRRPVGQAARSDPPADAFHAMVAPQDGEVVVTKPKASAFFATALPVYLQKSGADCVVVVGGSTSGCVRASVVDCHSWGFNTYVAADACFDRSAISHDVNLFDMNAKYATVLDTDELVSLVRATPGVTR